MNLRHSKFGLTWTVLSLSIGFGAVSLLRADDNTSLLKDAHKQLSLALNLGGDTPSDDDRTADINAAISDLQNTTFGSGRAEWAKSVATKNLKTALNLISKGDPDHEAPEKIRAADSIVRDLES